MLNEISQPGRLPSYVWVENDTDHTVREARWAAVRPCVSLIDDATMIVS